MRAALALARRGLGRTWPNPAVGCVIVKDGRVVGRGNTQPGGRPHAETVALAMAGEAARGATAYVTLEPCSHHGKTPPCAEALVAAGVSRVVAALEDPDPRVSGRGIKLLQEAGIATEVGLEAEVAEETNAGFLMKIRAGRPLVTLKLATSLDGRIATSTGESQWITGPAARARGHLLRAETDAIMVGSATALADDPELTCRIPGLADRSPVRVVVDGGLRLSPASKLANTARQVPVWVITRERSATAQALEDKSVEVIAVGDKGGHVDLLAGLKALAERGITRLLVEGGAGLAAALFREKLVDRLAWFQAPMVIGGDGLPALQGFGLDKLGAAPRFRRLAWAEPQPDLYQYFAVISPGE